MNSETKEELGVIENVGCGMRDCSTPCLWFTVKLLHGCALQILSWEEASDLICNANCHNINELNGRAVVVESKGSIVRFKRVA